jgi:peptidoglycan/xylan/chitin deacetylase (PgdA/CDA1 family)
MANRAVLLAMPLLIFAAGIALLATTAPDPPQVAPGEPTEEVPPDDVPQHSTGESITLPLSTLSPPATETTAMRTLDVPILMYHHVGNPNTYQTYNVDEAMFEWQMAYLEQHGYHSVGVDQIAVALLGGPPLPDKPVAITFDDGWALQITNTLPVLLRYHLRATYYIVTDVTGRHLANMSWEQVRQLRDAGMWIGSHTRHHGYLPGMSEQTLHDDLLTSREILEQQLAMPVITLAYPGGAFDARVERAAHDAGYVAAVSTRSGYAQQSDGLYRLRRVGIYGIDTQERFIAKVDETFLQKHWPAARGQARLTNDHPILQTSP